MPSEALLSLVHRDGVVHEVFQVACDLLFVNTEVGGELLGMVFERHRLTVRREHSKAFSASRAGYSRRYLFEIAQNSYL